MKMRRIELAGAPSLAAKANFFLGEVLAQLELVGVVLGDGCNFERGLCLDREAMLREARALLEAARDTAQPMEHRTRSFDVAMDVLRGRRSPSSMSLS
jgi:hypothetical protein